MHARVWETPQMQVLGGAQKGQGREGWSQEPESWKDASCWGPWQEHAWDHRRGFTALGVTGLGMKGRGENVGTGRGVRPGGPTLPRDTCTLRQVVSSPECIRGPAVPGDAASSHGQAAFLSYTTVGGIGEKAQGTSKRAGTIIWILLCHLQKATPFLSILTCRPAMMPLTFLTGALQSSIH